MGNKVNTLRFAKAEGIKKELTKAQIKEIQSMYKDLAEQTKKELFKLGNKTVSDTMQRAYLNSYLKELNGEISRINKLVEDNARKGILTISEAVVKEQIDRMGAYGLKGLNWKLCSIPTDIVATITSGQLYEKNWSLSGAIWSMDKQQQHKVQQIVASGIVKNASLEEIAKGLEAYVSPDRRKAWDMSRFYTGRTGKIDYNAMRLVKTMNNHAYMESFQRATEHDPFCEAYQWNNGHGGNVCPICEQLADDDKYGLGAGVYPKDDVPLDHPNGQCFITIVQTKSFDEVANDIANWYNGEGDEALNAELDEFSKQFGYKPPKRANKPLKVKGGKNIAKTVKTAQKLNNAVKEVDKVGTDAYFDKRLGKITSKLTKEQKEELYRGLKDSPEWYQKAFTECCESKIDDFYKVSGKTSYYDPSDNSVSLAVENAWKQAHDYGMSNKMHTAFHEMGHAMDYNSYSNGLISDTKLFRDAFNKDYQNVVKLVDSGDYAELIKDHNSRGIQDLVSAFNVLSGWEKQTAYWSHKNSYWVNGGLEQAREELVAHLSAAETQKVQYEYMKKYFPNCLKVFEKLLSGN